MRTARPQLGKPLTPDVWYVMCRMGVVGARALAHIRFRTSAPSLAVGELRASCPPPSTHAVSLGITMIMSCLLWHRVHARIQPAVCLESRACAPADAPPAQMSMGFGAVLSHLNSTSDERVGNENERGLSTSRDT